MRKRPWKLGIDWLLMRKAGHAEQVCEDVKPILNVAVNIDRKIPYMITCVLTCRNMNTMLSSCRDGITKLLVGTYGMLLFIPME